MSILIVCVAALAIGAATGRWWSIAITAAAVAAVAMAFVLSGSGSDNPILFILVVAEAMTAAGIVTRQRLTSNTVKA